MSIANGQHKIVFRKNESYMLWLNLLAIIRPNYKNSRGGVFYNCNHVRGLNLYKLQCAYSVEDIGWLKFVTRSLVLLSKSFSTLSCSNWNIHTSFWLMTNLTHSFLMYLFHASTCFEQQVIIIRRAKFY
jgi:hypothetical protein